MLVKSGLGGDEKKMEDFMENKQTGNGDGEIGVAPLESSGNDIDQYSEGY